MIVGVVNIIFLIMLVFQKGIAFVGSSKPHMTTRTLFSTIERCKQDITDTKAYQGTDADNVVLNPVVVCGPSGVGKGTIINKFMEEMGGKERFGFTVSHTTRSPRPGEVNGVHYHFCSKENIERDIAQGLFLEHAEVHGNYYGTSWQSLKDVQSTGRCCLLDIDVQGVKNLKRLESSTLKPKYIFIAPPSMERLEQRLSNRGTESAESLSRRTANARLEMEYGQLEGTFDCTIVNDDLDQACRDFAAGIDALLQP